VLLRVIGVLAALVVGAGALAIVLTGAADGVPDREAPDVRPLGGLVGVAVQDRLLDKDEGYAQLVDDAFASVTPENEMKMAVLQPERGRFDFRQADRIVDWAVERGKRVRGHTLVWHNQNPGWLTEGRFSREELLAIMREHITTVMRRYKGRVREWDVVNEAVEDDRGALRKSVWLDGIGPDYVEQAFRFARDADPDAVLVYNDYGAEGAGTKSDGVRRLLLRLRKRGVPLDAVGLQGHVDTAPIPQLDANLDAFRALGVRIRFTEVDVRVRPPASARELRAQARQYARLARACRRVQCEGFTVWGVDDADSWVPGAYPGFGDALLFDGDLRPKPAARALREALVGG
jgi:endo-1,4-beta-xylanase